MAQRHWFSVPHSAALQLLVLGFLLFPVRESVPTKFKGRGHRRAPPDGPTLMQTTALVYTTWGSKYQWDGLDTKRGNA